MEKTYKYNPKPLFEERMKRLLTDKADYQKYSEIIHKEPLNYIRCNTLKISPEELKKRLPWEIESKENPEIILVKSSLKPGEIGKSEEHLLGYYYVQELSSMLSVLALQPKRDETVLDLCSSPGSKTTQIAAKMENTGLIIANDKSLGRIVILSSNLERCGVTNAIMTQMDGIRLCEELEKKNFLFDRILVDAPCSGEGTLRSSPETFTMWNMNMITMLSGLQKKLITKALKLLKEDGILVYSTCTHAPEENEEVVDYALKTFPNFKLENISLPVKTREGITHWENKEFSSEVKKCCRIYPHDNDTEGFFVSKFRRIN